MSKYRQKWVKHVDTINGERMQKGLTDEGETTECPE
jgi:hypothetical protein